MSESPDEKAGEVPSGVHGGGPGAQAGGGAPSGGAPGGDVPNGLDAQGGEVSSDAADGPEAAVGEILRRLRLELETAADGASAAQLLESAHSELRQLLSEGEE
ncbi:MAG: hypothetical protein LBH48_08940 [Bifidobacteriaceae bacterium]|nr:hypothetical protein [Bifidobacteriaceae bacterium]